MTGRHTHAHTYTHAHAQPSLYLRLSLLLAPLLVPLRLASYPQGPWCALVSSDNWRRPPTVSSRGVLYPVGVGSVLGKDPASLVVFPYGTALVVTMWNNAL